MMEGLRIVEGEADETDGEMDSLADQDLTVSRYSAPSSLDLIPTDRKTRRRREQHLNVVNNNQEVMNTRARVHIDEKLEQRWRNLGTDVLTVVWRRNQPLLKKIQEMEKSVESTFDTLKVATASSRSISDNLSYLDDSLSAILEASELLKIGKNHLEQSETSQK